MQFAKLVLRCLLLVGAFGATFGIVCALLSPETFVYGKPPAFGELPAPLLGALWGGLEFLVPGAVVGLALAMAANVGDRPQVKAMFFRKPLWLHVGLVAAIASVGGIIGWVALSKGSWFVTGPLAAVVPVEKHAELAAVWWAYRGAHVANAVSGIALAIWIWRKRAEFDAIVRAQGR